MREDARPDAAGASLRRCNFWVRRQARTGCRFSRDRPLKTLRCRACVEFGRQVASAGGLRERSARLTAQPASATEVQSLVTTLSTRPARTAQHHAMTVSRCIVPARFACVRPTLRRRLFSSKPTNVGTSMSHHAKLMSPPRDIWGTQLPEARHDQLPPDTIRGFTSIRSIKNANLRGAVFQEMNGVVMLLKLDKYWTSPWNTLFGVPSPHTSRAELVTAR